MEVTRKEALDLITDDRGKGIPLKDVSFDGLALIYAFCQVKKKEFELFLISNSTRADYVSRFDKEIAPFYKYLRNHVKITEVRKEREKRKIERRSMKRKATKERGAIKKTQELMSYFNIPSQGLNERIARIKEKGTQSQEEYIKELYIMREAFIGKSQGNIATTVTEALWEVETVDGKLVKKQIYRNNKNKQMMTIKTQSHLPDPASLVAVKILDDLILTAETKNEIEITDEEQTELYIRHLEKSLKEQAEMKERASLLLESNIVK